ncbi:putative sulfatase PB10D8.02c [Fusarium oxysporum f. sp. albedinis]|nr:putative sulfatase PB10D8.02c [Fusarium oxysporum f. sp. albedinis]
MCQLPGSSPGQVLQVPGSLSSEGAASYGFTIHRTISLLLTDQVAFGRRRSLMPKVQDPRGLGGRSKPTRISFTKHHNLPRQSSGYYIPARHTV